MIVSVIVLVVFVLCVVLIDKKMQTKSNSEPQKKVPTKSLTLDEKINLEKTEIIQQLVSVIAQIEQKSINEVKAIIEQVKSDEKVPDK
ncbi:hypothetical protein [Enterococcus sp. 5H]|uniref:hypothetical protein n=1 Tax=Enterococcus sp. 5H TaxID=1229490 RepID=UPI002303FF50|nr:hypothetical protein [Enterococcus sp. 5H]MDA9471547.1 hypothetical protein [Enterococcus sp. 5H]